MVIVGQQVCWQTMFGEWFFGIVLELRGTVALVRRTAPAGSVCEVAINLLS